MEEKKTKDYILNQCIHYPIPEDIIESFERYLNHGISPGGFLHACLENNLYEAVARADDFNRYKLFEITCYMFHYLPGDSWGSEEEVEAWLNRFRKKDAKNAK